MIVARFLKIRLVEVKGALLVASSACGAGGGRRRGALHPHTAANAAPGGLGVEEPGSPDNTRPSIRPLTMGSNSGAIALLGTDIRLQLHAMPVRRPEIRRMTH